jgi:beta-N-acetylhexosaminidase
VPALAGCTSSSTPLPTTTSTNPAPAPAPTREPIPGPTPAQPAEPSAVDLALAEMDLPHRAAQLLVVGVGQDEYGAVAEGLVDLGVGGLFLKGRPTIAAGELAPVTAGWVSRTTGPPPWVATDQEGGAVRVLQGAGFPPFPSALDQAALPPDQLVATLTETGTALVTAGVTVNLAPVADLVDPAFAAQNPPIGRFDRQYGSDPAAVAGLVGAVVDTWTPLGVHPTLKHFPGLGAVTENTDTAALVVDATTTRTGAQVQVYRSVLAGREGAALPFVMVSSATYQQIDPGAPAMYSPFVVRGLLRAELGFDGVVITDDVGSADSASDRPVGQRAVDAIAAGGTLVLTNASSQAAEMVAALVARAQADPVFARTLDLAARTALTAKAEAGLLGEPAA